MKKFFVFLFLFFSISASAAFAADAEAAIKKAAEEAAKRPDLETILNDFSCQKIGGLSLFLFDKNGKKIFRACIFIDHD